jgi:hypothetical protein
MLHGLKPMATVISSLRDERERQHHVGFIPHDEGRWQHHARLTSYDGGDCRTSPFSLSNYEMNYHWV